LTEQASFRIIFSLPVLADNCFSSVKKRLKYMRKTTFPDILDITW